MPRLFTGLALPSSVTGEIGMMQSGIRGARWEPADKLHLTIEFLGDVDGGTARRFHEVLSRLSAPVFRCRLQGCGVFPPRGPARILWLGVVDAEPVEALHAEARRLLVEAGHMPGRRKFHPHVTIARMNNPSRDHVARWIADHNLYRSEEFECDALRLYSSVLSPAGSKYRVEAAFGLRRLE